MKEKRDKTIDNAKGIGMIIVVLFHTQILSGIWTQFHMPLFAFLSGLLYKDKYNSSKSALFEFLKKKIKGCYFPFFIYNILFLLFHNLFYCLHLYGSSSNGKLYTGKDYIIQLLKIITLSGGESFPGPMWYLIAMLEFTVLYVCIRYFLNMCIPGNEKLRNFSCTLICTAFLCIGFSEIDFPRMLNRSFVLLFYYNLGYLLHQYAQYILKADFGIKNFKLIIFSVIILLFGMRGGADWPKFSWIIVPSGIAGIVIVMCVSYLAEKYTLKTSDLLSMIGKNTIFILGTQYFFFKVANLLQIVLLKYDKTWLENYGVLKEEASLWKGVYFLCGLVIPLILIRIKDIAIKAIKEIGK